MKTDRHAASQHTDAGRACHPPSPPRGRRALHEGRRARRLLHPHAGRGRGTLLLRHGMHLHPLLPATARHQPGHSPTAILRHALPAGGTPGSTCSIPPFRTFPTNLVGPCRIPSRHATHTCHGASCTSCIPLLNPPYPNPTSILQPGCAGSTITLCAKLGI